jgi:predicted ATPase
VSIPQALRATVLRRLSCLKPGERAVLTGAAAIGRYVDVAILAAVVGRPKTSVRAVLERACELQIVVRLEDDRYSFRHALMRDIVYAQSVDGRTRVLHSRIARVLERMRASGESALADLAYHAWAAGDAPRAVRYNELAGDDAAAIHATGDARTYYERAQSLADAGTPDRARLTKKLQRLVEPVQK